MHRSRRISIRATLPCLGLILACAGGPPATEVTEARTAAVGFALTERATVVALAKRCQFDPVADESLAERAQAALQSWSARNRVVIDAANAYQADYLAVFARRSGRSKAAEQEEILNRQYSDAGESVARRMIDEVGGRGACPELLERLAGGGLDVSSSPEFEPVLRELIQKYVASDPPRS